GDRTQDARPVPDHGGRHARQMVGQGRRYGQLRRHPGGDRDRQGDHGVRGGGRGHRRQDPGARRHGRSEGRHRHRADRGRGRGRECCRSEHRPGHRGSEAACGREARRGTGANGTCSGRNPSRHGPAGRRAASLRRPHQGLPARPPPGGSAGHRPVLAEGQRPRRPHRPRRSRPGRGRSDGQAAAATAASAASARRRRGSGACSRAAVLDGNPARSGQAQQHAQDHRAPPDRVQAADPAHLPDSRHPPRRAAEAPR
ncbi:MAG: Dihydrolipoamide acetyltransferase component of pyruvate dehydrogenase complex, partial [uncultured Sphingomonas sp.]